MTTEKPRPKIKRVYVSVRDPDTGEHLHDTFYKTTPRQVLDVLRGNASEQAKAGAD